MSDIVRETLEKQEKIIEIMLCLQHEIPLEITFMICATTIRGSKTESNGDEENKGNGGECVSFIKYCCHFDTDPYDYDEDGDLLSRCHKDDGDLEGSFCGYCQLWICGRRSHNHKFCNCGKRLFGEDDEEEIELDNEETIRELFAKREEELETIDGLHDNMICCHVGRIDLHNDWGRWRCKKIADKFCADCNLAFCDSHLRFLSMW